MARIAFRHRNNARGRVRGETTRSVRTWCASQDDNTRCRRFGRERESRGDHEGSRVPTRFWALTAWRRRSSNVKCHRNGEGACRGKRPFRRRRRLVGKGALSVITRRRNNAKSRRRGVDRGRVVRGVRRGKPVSAALARRRLKSSTRRPGGAPSSCLRRAFVIDINGVFVFSFLFFDYFFFSIIIFSDRSAGGCCGRGRRLVF